MGFGRLPRTTLMRSKGRHLFRRLQLNVVRGTVNEERMRLLQAHFLYEFRGRH